MQYITRLKKQLKEVATYLNRYSETNSKVSRSTVGWQINHLLQVIQLTCKVLIQSNPKDYTWRFNASRMIFLGLGYFPRGKVKAPKAVRPPATHTLEATQELLNESKNLLDQVQNLPSNSNFKHPIFGLLNKKKTLKFLCVHTEHHLKILRQF